MPLLPALPVPAPPLVLGEVVLGEVELGDVELGALVEPLAEDEPLAEFCSLRQRSFSEPVRLSHWVLLPLTDGEVVALPVALGDELDEPVVPLADESLLEEPLCDDCAIAAAENANSAATVAVESVFNIVASPMWRFRDGDCAGTNASTVPSA